MDFRRIPFQFSSTDPAKRQAELQKRFGLPANNIQDKMHIDFENPGVMGFRPTEQSSASSSPRLQHRVPVFVEGDPEPMKSSVDSQGSPVPGRKPHVRVIPIEIEGDDGSSKRHRNLSGPANNIADRPRQNGSTWLPEEFAPYVRPPVIDPKPLSVPQERTIPIQVEGVQNKKAKTVPVQKPKAVPVQKPKSVNLKKETVTKHASNMPKVEKPATEVKKPLSGPALSLKKIEVVLEKLKTYQSDVEKFTGTVKEKQYRYLDEMLTRLMLELDDIDTMGNEEVRLSRKAAVKQVQASIDLLETKVTRESPGEVEDKLVGDKVDECQDVEMDNPASQEDNVMDEGGVIPNENLSKLPATETAVKERQDVVDVLSTQDENGVASESNENLSHLPTESASDIEQSSEVKEDIEMQSCVPDEQEQKIKASEVTLTAEDNFQVMEVDENIECETTTEPVITTVDSPIKESKTVTFNETTNMPIEVVCDEETSDAKETEPVVTLVDSPVKELTTNNEINDVPIEEICQVEVEEQVPSGDSCAKETVPNEEVSKSEPNKLETNNEHSDTIVSKHSSEIPDCEASSS